MTQKPKAKNFFGHEFWQNCIINHLPKDTHLLIDTCVAIPSYFRLCPNGSVTVERFLEDDSEHKKWIGKYNSFLFGLAQQHRVLVTRGIFGEMFIVQKTSKLIDQELQDHVIYLDRRITEDIAQKYTPRQKRTLWEEVRAMTDTIRRSNIYRSLSAADKQALRQAIALRASGLETKLLTADRAIILSAQDIAQRYFDDYELAPDPFFMLKELYTRK